VLRPPAPAAHGSRTGRTDDPGHRQRQPVGRSGRATVADVVAQWCRSPGAWPWPQRRGGPEERLGRTAIDPGDQLEIVTAAAGADRARRGRPGAAGGTVERMEPTETTGVTTGVTTGDDPFTVAGTVLASRLIMGSGGMSSPDSSRRLVASGTALATVAVRRVDPRPGTRWST